MNHHHFLLVSLPAQGHINPTLQLAKILTRNGARVTFATTVFGLHRMKTLPTYQEMSYASFSDGYDDEASRTNFDFIKYMADLTMSNKDYIDWLDSREDYSVVYVSFGSIVQLQKEQKEEMLNGLVESGRPFLWVVRSSPNCEEAKTMVENGLTENGLIVPWCAQLEVLSHKSVGCFVTHCGWNSTMESIVSGVPIVGCPHFSDQLTNAKLVEEVWCNGVRATGNEEGVVERKEIKRCLDIVMGDGEEGELIRKNALKWRSLAVEAVKEGGSSYNNLKMFLESL